MAEAVAYLASDRAQWITGASLNVDGGELPAIWPHIRPAAATARRGLCW
ncbi:hypothetical protein [Streptomyces sp. MMBL 11-3]